MARLELDGFEEFGARLNELPDSVRTQALDAMAEAAEPAVRRSGETMGVREQIRQSDVFDMEALFQHLTK